MINRLKELTFDSNANILVTGCAGFIGSHLTEFFLKKGVRVRGIDNLSTGSASNLEEIAQQKNCNLEFIKGDIRDYNDCLEAVKDVDIVFHQAALGSVQRSLEKPIDSSDSNITGTLNMLKASVENKVGRFIYASSSSVYGDSVKLPKDESMSPNPKSIYAVTKLTAEYYCRLFHDLYGLKTVSLRYFNVFGNRQNPDSIYSAVIPRFLKNIKEGIPPVIYGNGEQSRDFTFIDNVVYANYLAASSDNKGIFGNYYNIACGKRTSLNEIIKILSKFLGKEIKAEFQEERKGDVKHSLASIEKAKDDLGYRPIIDFNDGLVKVAR